MFVGSHQDLSRCLPPTLDCWQTVKVISASDSIHNTLPTESIINKTTFSMDLKATMENVDFPEFDELTSELKYNILIVYALYGSALDASSPGLHSLHLACGILLLDPKNNTELRNALKIEGINLHYVPAHAYLNALLGLVSEDLVETYKTIVEMGTATVQKIALAFFGPYLCLLGKKLTVTNANKWGERISTAMYSALGLTELQTTIGLTYPTYEMAITFFGSVASKIPIRAGIVNGLIELSNKGNIASHIKIFVGVVLSRLSFTDLGNFRLIDTYILRTNLYMLLWGWVATSIPDLKKAYDKFESFGSKAPYLKLITNPNDCPEFSSFSIKKLAELSRLIGIIMGQQQLTQVTTGFQFPNEEMVKSRIEAIMIAGASASYVWSDVAGKYIASKSDNPNLYEVLGGKGLYEKINTVPSAPPVVPEITS